MPAAIRTVSANCQDCYRCVRKCPIDAIWVRGGQAYVNGALCVECGNCVRECPQHAKVIRDGLSDVRAMIEAGETVVASVDPSFAAVFPGFRAARVPAALRMLGFAHVSEAAEGAERVAAESARLAKANGVACITSACAAVVSYIEKYKHPLVPYLLPVVPPMVIHGRMLKARYGGACKVVYIGPCAAKKNKAERPGYAGAVDAVLTYDELLRWLSDEKINLSTCPESGFETHLPDGSAARLTAVEGGLLRAAGIERRGLEPGILHVSGVVRVRHLLDTPPEAWDYQVVELSFCRGGCAGGPCMPPGSDPFTAARDIYKYAERISSEIPLWRDISEFAPHAENTASAPGDLQEVSLQTLFKPVSIDAFLPPVDEAQIERILAETGKGEDGTRLDCGACGYNTCRENAIAVARGSAEPGMCSSYSRKRGERRADRIIETSPNGIVVVGMDLTIVHMNKRFMRMFNCSSDLRGLPISHIVDADGFEKLTAGAEGTQDAIRTRDAMKYQELIYTLPGENELIGIYVDVSATTFTNRQVDLIRGQSLRQAQELLGHQIRFSQEMAHFLGKSTAQTEELVGRMVDLFAADDEKPGPEDETQ